MGHSAWEDYYDLIKTGETDFASEDVGEGGQRADHTPPNLESLGENLIKTRISILRGYALHWRKLHKILPFIEHYFYVVIEFRVTYLRRRRWSYGRSLKRARIPNRLIHPSISPSSSIGYICAKPSQTWMVEDTSPWRRVLRKFQFATLFAVPLSFSNSITAVHSPPKLVDRNRTR